MSQSYQSPISPGLSWYEATVGERPSYPSLDAAKHYDVVIIGGGFTGLNAALHLAEKGVDVALLEAHRFGDGASGRNGGQMGTGQRLGAEEAEKAYGLEHAKALFDLAESAKKHLLDIAEKYAIEIDYVEGQMSLAHRKRYLKGYQEHVEALNERFNYPHIHYMDHEETSDRLGSNRYFGGSYDSGTGHIHPMKLVTGLAKAASNVGASIFENSKVSAIRKNGLKTEIIVNGQTLTADRVLIATNGYNDGLEPKSTAHIMPIRSFIAATEPLPDALNVLKGFESVDDTRFVVRYFRKMQTGEMLFGGREAYTADNPRDISSHIRKQMCEIFPQLEDVKITHSWGGSVGITLTREPFVREVMPGVTSIGGFSGHGIMLSNYTGKLFADLITDGSTALDVLRDLKVPAFPGGARFRKPLLFAALTWYAMLDRI